MILWNSEQRWEIVDWIQILIRMMQHFIIMKEKKKNNRQNAMKQNYSTINYLTITEKFRVFVISFPDF